MKVCIRADGGNTIGMGHIIRSLALAKELKLNEIDVFFACRRNNPLTDKYKPGIDKIKDEGFEIVFLDENKFKEEIVEINADCLITDSYDVDTEYFNLTKEHFELNVCIYDKEPEDVYFNVDFLINPDLYAEKINYNVNRDTELLLGSDYIILREEFKSSKGKLIRENIEDVMITVGGSDINNLTKEILMLVKDLDLNFHVVVGQAFQYKEELLKIENENIKLYFNVNMYELMMKSDLAISSCGTTLYELASCGTPTIGLVVIDDQMLEARIMDELGIIKLSNLNKLKEDITNLTLEDRLKMNKVGRKLVDGMGAKRIAHKILPDTNELS